MFSRLVSRRTFSSSAAAGATDTLSLLGRPLSESSMYALKALQLVGVLYCVKTYGVDFSNSINTAKIIAYNVISVMGKRLWCITG